MNERIQELKKQALEYAMAVHEGHIVPPLNKEVWPIGNVFDEKFAELIVRECAKIAKHNVMNISTYGDAEFVEEQIKQHFGVEE